MSNVLIHVLWGVRPLLNFTCRQSRAPAGPDYFKRRTQNRRAHWFSVKALASLLWRLPFSQRV